MIKNALYIPAFIIFIIISLVVKSFWDFPTWSTIVVAVTTASWLFSFADMYASIAKSGEESVSLFSGFPTESLRLLECVKKAAKTRLDQCENHDPESPICTKQETTDRYARILTDFEETEQDLRGISERLEKTKERAARNNSLASFCTIMGFLSIFCILAFEPVASYFTASLDEMTLLSFALMLFTRYYESRVKNQLTEGNERINRVLTKLRNLQNSLENEVFEHIPQ